MNTQENQVYNELLKEISRRKMLQRLDSLLTHSFVWISVIASFVAALLIAKNGVKGIDAIYVAIIAGLPGLCLTIAKTFDFTQRAAWGSLYIIDLLNLRDKIDFNTISIKDGAVEFRTLMKKYEMDFTKIGFFNQSFQDSNKNS